MQFEIPSIFCNCCKGCSFRSWKFTDELNSTLSFLVLCLLKKHHPASFGLLDLSSFATRTAVSCSPPFRWERHKYQVCPDGGSVDVVLDVGHNQAAIQEIAKRLKVDFPEKNYK